MDTVSRPCVIIGNWKMNKTLEEARAFIENLLPSLASVNKTVGLAVPYTLIHPLTQLVKGHALLIGGQNMNDASAGAFTGEIAATMLVDVGARFVLLGHSERRLLYHEDDALINRKVQRAVEVGLQPVLCVGETEQEYETKQTHAVVERQLSEGLKDLQESQLKQLIIAYEPVWAIGGSYSATPDDAQAVHHFCRQVLGKLFSEEFARQVVIQYGGAVNSSNAKELLAEPDIDGLLIGRAALSLESFTEIVNNEH